MKKQDLTYDHELISTIHKTVDSLAKDIGKEFYRSYFKNKNKTSYTLKYCITPINFGTTQHEIYTPLFILYGLVKKIISKCPEIQKHTEIKITPSAGMGSGKGIMGNVRLVISNNILNDNSYKFELFQLQCINIPILNQKDYKILEKKLKEYIYISYFMLNNNQINQKMDEINNIVSKFLNNNKIISLL